MKLIKIFLISLLLIFGLVACGKKDEKAADDSEKKPKKQAEAQAKTDKIYTAHYLEEEVETLPEVNHAIVLMEEKDAYVALKLRDDKMGLDENLKNKVVEQIRITDPEVKTIHISNNLDFHTRMDSIARDIERGLPEKAIGDSFGQTVRQIFPEVKK